MFLISFYHKIKNTYVQDADNPHLHISVLTALRVLSDPANASIPSVLTVIYRLLTKTERVGLWDQSI